MASCSSNAFLSAGRPRYLCNKNRDPLDIQCGGSEEKTHGFNINSSTAFKMISEKWKISTDAACWNNALALSSVGSNGVPWLGYFAAI